MQKNKNEKGITLIALVISIIILLMISLTAIINGSQVVEFNKYAKFKEDMDVLTESVGVLFSGDEDISKIGPEYIGNTSFLNQTQNGKQVKNTNDGDKYYLIDVEFLNSNLTQKINKINYGNNSNYKTLSTYNSTNNTFSGDDVYIVNGTSKTVYYTSGVEYKGITYYRLSEDYTEISKEDFVDNRLFVSNILNDSSKKIEDYYGYEILNYNTKNPDGTATTWRLFYVDESTNEVFLIADQVANRSLGLVGDAEKANVASVSAKLNTQWESLRISAKGQWNAKSVAWLLDQDYWDGTLASPKEYDSDMTNPDNTITYNFKDSTKVNAINYIIGGPTIELYAKSYNSTHPNTKICCTTTQPTGAGANNGKGYYVGQVKKNEQNEEYDDYSYGSGYSQRGYSLGASATAGNTDHNGIYWRNYQYICLASPSAYSSGNVVYVVGEAALVANCLYYGNSGGRFGVRPLVSLKLSYFDGRLKE